MLSKLVIASLLAASAVSAQEVVSVCPTTRPDSNTTCSMDLKCSWALSDTTGTGQETCSCISGGTFVECEAWMVDIPLAFEAPVDPMVTKELVANNYLVWQCPDTAIFPVPGDPVPLCPDSIPPLTCDYKTDSAMEGYTGGTKCSCEVDAVDGTNKFVCFIWQTQVTSLQIPEPTINSTDVMFQTAVLFKDPVLDTPTVAGVNSTAVEFTFTTNDVEILSGTDPNRPNQVFSDNANITGPVGTLKVDVMVDPTDPPPVLISGAPPEIMTFAPPVADPVLIDTTPIVLTSTTGTTLDISPTSAPSAEATFVTLTSGTPPVVTTSGPIVLTNTLGGGGTKPNKGKKPKPTATTSTTGATATTGTKPKKVKKIKLGLRGGKKNHNNKSIP